MYIIPCPDVMQTRVDWPSRGCTKVLRFNVLTSILRVDPH